MTNVLLIMTDQQRADSLGCCGNRNAVTPNLDALACRGAVLANHFTPNQMCSPSRSTLFSGLFPRHHGLTRNGVSLPEDTRLLTHDLASCGYRVHGAGKFHFQPILASSEHAMPDSNAFWSLPKSESWNGPFFGFDSVDIVIGESAAVTEGGHYARWLETTSPEAVKLYLPENALAPAPDDLDEVWKSAIPQNLHYNSWITDRACDFLQHHNEDQPFFLFVSYPDPHHPFSPPEPWCDLVNPEDVPLPKNVPGELERMPDYILQASRSECNAPDKSGSYFDFLLDPGKAREQGFMQTTEHLSEPTIRQAIAHTHGMVAMIDDCVGQILAKLEEKGLSDDTIVIFTSDHGELLGDHGLIRKGPPPYVQLLQLPMIVAGPSIVAGERRQLTSHLDIRATILELLEIEGDGGDGISFAEILRDGTTAGRSRLFAEYHPRASMDRYNQSLLTHDWRLTVYPQRRDWGELFDRNTDPGEHHNLYFDPAFSTIKELLTAEIARDWPPSPDAGEQAIAVY